MFNLALLLQLGSRHKEAAEYWRQYLANEAQSEWAARARRSLKFCEMQLQHCLSPRSSKKLRAIPRAALGVAAGAIIDSEIPRPNLRPHCVPEPFKQASPEVHKPRKSPDLFAALGGIRTPDPQIRSLKSSAKTR